MAEPVFLFLMEKSMAKLPQQQRLAVLLCTLGLGAWSSPSLADVQYKFNGFGTLGGGGDQ